MVAIPAEVRVFLRNVGKKFAPQKIYLFGSRARGNAAEESDWDFITFILGFFIGRLPIF